MSLLELKEIGKIYVSEGNVSVGIRGVNLAFEKNEFVAITGKSGSGKSTLLNVLSGMDSYEEGEMLVEGEPTSHFIEQDWEEYREKYISFIFQDYNIIDSFTVLENVELALSTIEDKRERRARALELIDRVGLSDHVKHKGSHLSGGQKQRTVIARALAKDSPIILADEPCGNLDSATTGEIISLLCEVCKDKLLIMVTHDFDEVKDYATRHIRIYDGKVESDSMLAPVSQKCEENEAEPKEKSNKKTSKAIKKGLREGFWLGISIFRSKPKLSAFLSLLFIIASLAATFVTSLCSEGIEDLFSSQAMFNYIDGRVVLTKQNGAPISDDELKALAEKYGAETYIHYDYLLDSYYYLQYKDDEYEYAMFGEDVDVRPISFFDGGEIVGRMPEGNDEILLSLPISLQGKFGKDRVEVEKVVLDSSVEMRVCGIHYYYDNRIMPTCYLTDEALAINTAARLLFRESRMLFTVFAIKDGEQVKEFNYSYASHSFSLDGGKIYLADEYINSHKDSARFDRFEISYSFSRYKYDYFVSDQGEAQVVSGTLDESVISTTAPEVEFDWIYSDLYIGSDILLAIGNELLESSYTQASLFFADDRTAALALEGLTDEGYVAVLSDTEYNIDSMEAILASILGVMMLGVWFAAMAFLSSFIYLCSFRALESFRADIAIMRSMGITSYAVKAGIYFRVAFCLIPSFAALALFRKLTMISPKINGMLTFVGIGGYIFVVLALLVISALVTKMQIGKLFKMSVKKSFRGGAA